MSSSAPKASVIILGGGFTGAAVAYHLASRYGASGVAVVEPRETLGGGLAYSATEPTHRINVPAAKMSLRADEPEHFARWLQQSGELDRDPEAVTEKGDAFPQRAVFGRYVEAHLKPYLDAGQVRHVRARAEAVEALGDGYRVALSDGTVIEGRVLVLAVTHPMPAIPAPLRGLAGSGALIADPYASGVFDDIAPTERVVIVGTGLTAADLVASLEAHGHRGAITLVSRHGLVSGRHAATAHPARGDFSSVPHASAVSLFRQIRSEMIAGHVAGEGWQPVFDALRTQGLAIWAGLDPRSRRQVLRHLRSYWDVHRFRIAPQVADAWDRLLASGRGRLVAGRLIGAAQREDEVVLSLRPRHGVEAIEIAADRILLATGPDHGRVIADTPVLASLAAAGLLEADPYRLGLHSSRTGRAVGAGGVVSPTLFIAGPLARATFGELMGLPEVSRYAEFIALEIAGAGLLGG